MTFTIERIAHERELRGKVGEYFELLQTVGRYRGQVEIEGKLHHRFVGRGPMPGSMKEVYIEVGRVDIGTLNGIISGKNQADFRIPTRSCNTLHSIDRQRYERLQEEFEGK